MINSFSGFYRFLSNFYPCPIVYEGIDYHTTEHAYQAAKTTDMSEKLMISLVETPGKAKKLGNTFNVRPDWNNIKLKVMMDVTCLKYNGTNDLSKMLIDTDPHVLIEGNTWGDTFWGVYNGVGCNHLGNTLMTRRAQLLGHIL